MSKNTSLQISAGFDVLKAAFILVFAAMFFSCTTASVGHVTPHIPEGGMPIMGRGTKNADGLQTFLLTQNPVCDRAKTRRLAEIYCEEASCEGVNSDVAFVQMCLETGFLRFGNLVRPDMNNFCGLGAINEKNPGVSFETERDGVRAHIQHLKAYASADPLVNPVIDPRYRFVMPKGRSPTVLGLSGTWATDKSYGEKLTRLLETLLSM